MERGREREDAETRCSSQEAHRTKRAGVQTDGLYRDQEPSPLGWRVQARRQGVPAWRVL